ncbi:hypothetical protein [Candidatus Hodarchaeum mangrovi]
MKRDPFFDREVADFDDSILSRTPLKPPSFFLCSLDNIDGLLLLYSIPPHLKDDQNEKNILKTHSIWKIDDIPIRVDLKITNYIYAAVLLNENLQSDYKNLNQRIYAIIIKLSKTQQIENTFLLSLKKKIEEIVSVNIDLLHKREKYTSNPLKKQFFLKNALKIARLNRQFEEAWLTFIFNLSQSSNKKTSTTLPEEIIEEKSSDIIKYSTPLYKQKISMRTFSTDDDPGHILVILFNEKNIDLKDVLIHVSKRSEFFSETVWEQKLDLWPQKEDIILDFTQSDEIQNYLIKVSSRKTTIAIKSLKIDPL